MKPKLKQFKSRAKRRGFTIQCGFVIFISYGKHQGVRRVLQ